MDEEKENQPKLSTNKIITIVCICLGILAIAIFFIPVSYTAVEGYTVKEPYTETEWYTESEPYTTTECNDKYALYKTDWGEGITSVCIQNECASYDSYCTEKNFWGNCIEYSQSCASYKCVKSTKYCEVKIENKERESIQMDIALYKWDYDNKQEKLVKTVDNTWVNALDDASIKWDFTYLSTESVGCYYRITKSPTIQECKDVIRYRDVSKSRQVTKYQDSYKEKQVLKKDTLFNVWTGRAPSYYKI